MHTDENWRPSAKAVAAAEQRLANTARFQTRLRIVLALKEERGAPLKAIARAATTRKAVVEAFLGRWRRDGLGSVTTFGPPKRLNQDQLNMVRKELTSGKRKALDEVQWFVELQFSLTLDIRVVRSYCRQLGFELPVTIRSKKLHDSWSGDNIDRQAGNNQILKKRLMAILRACSEPTVALRKVAEEGKQLFSPASTLRADLKAIKPSTTLEQFVMHHLRLPMLDRKTLRPAFYKWASEKHALNGRCPSAREAAEFLKEHGIKLEVKSVYKHLDEWRREARIESRKYQSRETFMPSDGISVWSNSSRRRG